MKRAEKAIIKKDIRGITSNRRLFSALWIVPLALTVVLPSIFVCAAHFAPDDPDVLALLELLPGAANTESVELAIAGIIFNYILPAFFLMIPIMTASVMAASAFVGEKEKHTLETLLYCPLSVKEIFRAKVLASFLLSMLVVSCLVCSNADCPGAGIGISDGESAPSRRGLGDRPVPALTGSLADRRDPHREELRQGAECGRVPAERSLSYHTGHPSRSRTVCRSDDPECVDPAGLKHRVRAAGAAAAAESGEAVYL